MQKEGFIQDFSFGFGRGGEGNLGSHKTKTTSLKMSILKIQLVKCTISHNYNLQSQFDCEEL